VFARLQRSGGERFEARLAMAALVSRVVGVHRLLLVNFYPFLQRYLQPHQRDVTQLLAALVQARPARRAAACFRRTGPGQAV
jgi:protein SDA1